MSYAPQKRRTCVREDAAVLCLHFVWARPSQPAATRAATRATTRASTRATTRAKTSGH